MRFWIPAVLLACLAAPVLADGPATRPAHDQSTPLAALRSFNNAMGAFDAEAVRRLVHVRGKDGQKLLDAIAGSMPAGRRLADAAAERFGEAGRQLVADSLELRDADVKAEGDRATVTTGDDEDDETVPMVRIDGLWKVAIEEFIADSALIPVADAAGAIQAAGTACDELANDLRAGRHGTVEDLARAYGEAISKATMSQGLPEGDSVDRPEDGNR